MQALDSVQLPIQALSLTNRLDSQARYLSVISPNISCYLENQVNSRAYLTMGLLYGFHELLHELLSGTVSNAQDSRGKVPAVAPKGNLEVIPRAQKVSRNISPLHLVK